MLFILSPAKALDFERQPTTAHFSQPDFLDDAAELVAQLRTLTPAQLAGLMKLSDRLAALNVARYSSWSRPFTPDTACSAVTAFDGDVYAGLSAATLSDAALAWAQAHVRILSGLYGVLRPLDLIQPYRLEMGSRLPNRRGENLYAFWGDKPTQALNAILEKQAKEHGREAVLVNLASAEYFKAVQANKLHARLVTPQFEDWKDGRYKIISFHAKRARGLMCRFAVTQQLETVEQLSDFAAEGYAFCASASDRNRLVFRRG